MRLDRMTMTVYI